MPSRRTVPGPAHVEQRVSPLSVGRFGHHVASRRAYPHRRSETTMTVQALADRRDRALGTGAQLFYNQPLHIVRGEGVYLYDAGGRRYVDMYNNVPCVGHADPTVVEAMVRQQSTLNVHSRYLHEGVVEFAERLTRLHPRGIESVVFSCTGTEANEVALQHGTHLNRQTRHRVHQRDIPRQQRSGRAAHTPRRLAVCGRRRAHDPLSGVVQAARSPGERNAARRRISRSPARRDPQSRDRRQRLRRAHRMLDLRKRRSARRTARLHAPCGGNGARRRWPRDCRRSAGWLLPHGRWWGYEVTEFTPDIVVTGKPMGNGLPLAATAARNRWSTGFALRRVTSTPLRRARCKLQSAWPCST